MIVKSYIIEQNFNLDKALYLFYGVNLGLKNEIKQKIKTSYKNYEILHFLQEDILKKNEILLNEISNISLFEKNKLFIIEEASDKIQDTIDKISKKISDNKVIVFASVLDKKSKLRNFFEKSKDAVCVACYEDTENQLKNLILKKLSKFEGLNPENINLILQTCNNDRSKLNNELDKIRVCFRGKKIESEKLAQLLNLKVNEDFNILKDEAFLGNKEKTNKLLSETLIESDKNIYYLSIINQRLNKLNSIIKNLNNSNIENEVNKLKPPIFWKDKTNFINQANKWDENKIESAFKKTYNLEIGIKTNSLINHKVLLRKLLIDICEIANS